MSEALSALHASIDAGLGGVLLANMVEAWLAGNPDCLESVEAADEPQDHRTTPEQTRLHLCAPLGHSSTGAQNNTGADPPTFMCASRRMPKCSTTRRARSASMHCARWRWSWAGANRRFARSTGTWA